ncbi:MAG TPA: sigma-54 dependent transcriptional regulator [Myxococcales bacterium]
MVIFDPEADRTCGGNCCQIEGLVREALAPDAIAVADRLSQFHDSAEPDLIVLRTPARQPLPELLRTLRSAWPGTSILGAMCNVTPQLPELVESLRHGLDDFLCCPFAGIDLLARLRRLVPDRRLPSDEAGPTATRLRVENMIGESPNFVSALTRLLRIAASDATVLISGETGVGKGLAARAIHFNGARRSGPFTALNCSAIPDHLFENELFGHARGAYTDACTSEQGLVAGSKGGTLFLDEIDTLSPQSQAKLLRLLQDGEYRPLGSCKAIRADVRIIAATNSDLRQLVAASQFRNDLFHRLNILDVHIPALRDRASDIPLLARHFLAHYRSLYGKQELQLTAAAVRKMLAYAWPGNVRELEAVLHRAVVFASGEVLRPEDVDVPGTPGESSDRESFGSAKREVLDEFERTFVTRLLLEHRGNVSRASMASGRDRRSFQRLLRKYGISASSFRPQP